VNVKPYGLQPLDVALSPVIDGPPTPVYVAEGPPVFPPTAEEASVVPEYV
jgi:hypothetical protein